MKPSGQLPDTFTPLFEGVKNEMGLYAALVYGRVWRYCQSEGGQCYVSQQTIAEKLGLSRSTVYRSLKKLVAAGYLVDLTPRRRHTPHRYLTSLRATAALVEGHSVGTWAGTTRPAPRHDNATFDCPTRPAAGPDT